MKLSAARNAAGARRQPHDPTARPRPLDERVLVDRARHGDRDAFEKLVRLHAAGLHAVVSRLCATAEEAEEVTQETFLRAWRGIARFQGDCQMFTWLYRIGVNEASRRGARRGAQQTSSLDEHPEQAPADWRPTPDLRVEQKDLRAALEEAVRGLHPDYRAPLILRDIEGLSTADAARILELGEGAFKSRLHRARLTVREALAAHLGDRA